MRTLAGWRELLLWRAIVRNAFAEHGADGKEAEGALRRTPEGARDAEYWRQRTRAAFLRHGVGSAAAREAQQASKPSALSRPPVPAEFHGASISRPLARTDEAGLVRCLHLSSTFLPLNLHSILAICFNLRRHRRSS